MDFEIEIVTLSRQGGRDYNEDAFGHWNDERHVLCVVADGAGGHGGGQDDQAHAVLLCRGIGRAKAQGFMNAADAPAHPRHAAEAAPDQRIPDRP